MRMLKMRRALRWSRWTGRNRAIVALTVTLPFLVSMGSAAKAATAESPRKTITTADHLDEMIYSRAEVEQWLAGTAFPFARYDAELGWLVNPMRRQDGVEGAIASYNYDGPNGARRLVNAADGVGRINTYGDSFTQCDQVSDGETWQEYLAAHLGEPVRNYGVGGYSVYQAYLRMLRVERESPARLIILNIFDDDHFRNLDAWRQIRGKKHPLFIQPTLPHLQVDLENRECVRMPNPCPTAESVYNLCDRAWVHRRFERDFSTGIMIAHRNARQKNPEEAYRAIQNLATTIGITTRVDESQTLEQAAEALHARAALFATENVVDWVEAYAREQGQQVLYVLSYRAQTIARRLKEGTRFDQTFVDFLEAKKLPYVDVMEAHVRDFGGFSLTPEEYLRRYYIGHYNPAGNFFVASAIKPKLVQMLDPRPPAYRVDANDYWKRR